MENSHRDDADSFNHRNAAFPGEGRSANGVEIIGKDELIKTDDSNRERAVIVGVVHSNQTRYQVNEYLDELELLADTAGADVLDRMIQERDRMDPAFMIGRGKAQELATLTRYLDLDMVIFDDDLSPAQENNIEALCKVKILDRSGLILDIFAKHARTREARIQVEMAQLKYLSTRLTGQWTHLSRQVGGIGVRGPGETQLEFDRRVIKKRIMLLGKELEKIAKQRQIRRKFRQGELKAALIGYTNVGKSTLLNALTKANVLVEDRLFATLDATIRSLQISEHQRILLIDTVGFIRKLPHHLVASFKSTLEEARDADILLHIIDVSHPNFADQMITVENVLKELELDHKPVLKVYNKIDAVEDTSIVLSLQAQEPASVFISAEKGIFLNEVCRKLVELTDPLYEMMHIELPVEKADLLSRFYPLADVVKVEYNDRKIDVSLRTNKANRLKIFQLVS